MEVVMVIAVTMEDEVIMPIFSPMCVLNLGTEELFDTISIIFTIKNVKIGFNPRVNPASPRV